MNHKTQVGIIGAGPAGLTLALLLQQAGIHCIVLEHRSREYVESRVRAGVLQQKTINIFNELNVAERLHKEGEVIEGICLSFEGVRHRISFNELTPGKGIIIYAQQEVQKDLIAACIERGIEIKFDTAAIQIKNMETTPEIIYEQNSKQHILSCDFIAGCDGFHGISRKSLPQFTYKTFCNEYSFSWLGILAEAAPSANELIYAYHERGFALHSFRSKTISRLYLQVDNNESINYWSDDRIWAELTLRLEAKDFTLSTGKILEKSITPVRSFMMSNMQYGKLFLAGDAAHILPPTGAKGLNLAVADAKVMAEAFIHWYKNKNITLLDSYSADSLKRIWKAIDFSNFMTNLFHRQTLHDSSEYYLQKAKFDNIQSLKAQAAIIAENYVGMN